MDLTLITLLRGIAACFFLITVFMSISIHNKTKKKTDIWLLITVALLIAAFESTVNALEWSNILPDTMDSIGEYLTISFSLVWIYIAYRFLSVETAPKKLRS